jgi:hypothetical protein
MSTNNSNNEMNSDEMMAMITSLKATIQRSEATIQRNEATIQRNEATIQRIDYEGSVEEMINFFGGIPDMPQVKGLEPHEDNNRNTRFSVDAGFVTANDLNFEINLKNKDTNSNLKSFLLFTRMIDKDGEKILSYQNEATVADYVQGVVTMCLQSLGYFKSCFLYKEMRIFSLRPDLILVLHPEKGIILIIEVKMPGEELFESQRIAAQVADYLVVQYRLGNSMPLVLLSSYREACLCHLKPGSLDRTEEEEEEEGDGGGGDNPLLILEEVADSSNYRKIVEEGANLLSEGTNLAHMMGDGGKEQEDSNSPKKLAFKSRADIPKSLAQNGAGSNRKRRRQPTTVKYVSPEVVYSAPFNLKSMMQGVSLAIVCGLVSLKNKVAATPEEVWPIQGSLLDGLHPCVETDTFKWARVKNMTIDYTKIPLSNGRNKYILVREIGQGKTGRVYLGVDETGNAYALKFYLPGVGAETYNQQKRDDNFEDAQKKVQVELERWCLLQPDYNDYVARLTLNKQNVLRMPVFAPVSPEERRGVLPAVTEKLIKFFNEGFVYNELRWQHIGCRLPSGTAEGYVASNLEIVMLDLESLKGVTEETRNHVTEQIKSLTDRMEIAVASGPTSAFMAAAHAQDM